MREQFTTTTTVSWGEKLKESIASVGIGFSLFIGSFALLWWNEGNSVHTANDLREAQSILVEISTDQVLSENEGKVVYLMGNTKVNDRISDPLFGVQPGSVVALKRTVEMYQWKEKSKTKKSKNAGGSTTKRTTYSYSKEWSTTYNNSANFEKSGYDNPPMVYKSKDYYAKDVDLGAFKLPQMLIEQKDDQVEYTLENAAIVNIPDARLESGQREIYIGTGTMTTPDIGDYRVRYDVVQEGPVSVIAQQKGSTFSSYQGSSGTSVDMLEPGTLSSQDMFKKAHNANKIMTWLLRVVGFFMMFIGITCIFKPLVAVADVIPFVGGLLEGGIALFAGLVSLVLSFITIALAWLFYRPILSLTLIGIAVAIMYYISTVKKKKEQVA